jgi:hypothetical protein
LNNNINKETDKTSESNENYIPYCIPKSDDNYLPNQIIQNLIQISSNAKTITKNSELIIGCKVISFENKFTVILDSAYKSFLLGMYYATVTLTSLAAERMCYDFIENAKIEYREIELEQRQKDSLYRIPYSELLNFLLDLNEFDEQIKKNLFKINTIRNKYVHPNTVGNPFDDAKNTLNLLCETIDLIIKHKREVNKQ